jgi:hypothetical protein
MTHLKKKWFFLTPFIFFENTHAGAFEKKIKIIFIFLIFKLCVCVCVCVLFLKVFLRLWVFVHFIVFNPKLF